MALWVRRPDTVHQLPAVDQRAGVIEGLLKIHARLHALLEKGIAEISPVPFGRAAKRGVLVVRGGHDDGIVVRQRWHEDSRIAGRNDYEAVIDAFAVQCRSDLLR